MKKIFFVVNNNKEFDFKELIRKYLSKVSVDVGKSLPKNSEKYDLIILWSYQKIIKKLPKDENVILFHSTNLPNGKGWAPIYHTLIRKKKYFTISGIIANEKVDAGNIIVKARFKIQDNHTAEYLRKWDHEISIMLIREILKKMKGHIKGKKQIAKGDKYPRRYQKDNQIDIKLPFKQTINHIRACEDDHPAFFYINKTKYIIKVEPEKKPNFPKNLEIKFYD
jgi:methionyl-tRNA formyltransferase